MTTILFFSNNCPHSVKFIEILKKAGEVDSISKFICVDKVRKSRPIEVSKYGIVEVPTVLVGNRKKAGAEAFQWLYGIVNIEAPPMQRQKAPRSHQKVISGIQSGSMFDQYEGVVNLNTDNSIYGDSPVPPEGKIEKEDFFVMQNDNLAGSSKFVQDEEDKSGGASQFDKEYKRLLEERNNL